MNIPETKLKRVVIIGAGFGGLRLAKQLDRSFYQVVLIDRHNYHTFQPLLYQVATAGLEPDSIAYPIRKILKKKKETYFRMAAAERVDESLKTLYTDIGPIGYDYLVIACGSDTNFFGLKNVEKLAMSMKSVREALDLRSLILQNYEEAVHEDNPEEREALMNIVIVGGGPTGVELAGAIAELKKHILPKDYPELQIDKMKVFLVESGSQVLSTMSEKSGKKAQSYLTNMGVQLRLNTHVSDYDGRMATTKEGIQLPSKTLIWAAGVKGNIPSSLGVGASTRGTRLMVDEYNELIGHKSIYAIGDVSAHVTDDQPRGLPMVAPVAVQQGQTLAKNLNNQARSKQMKPFNYRDKGSMATVGRNKAVVDLKKVKLSGFIAWIIWAFVHLMQLVGFRNRIIALFNWSWSYWNYDKGVRLIIRPFKRKKKSKVKRVEVF